MLPFFPEEVNNVTVKVGQNAVLKCKVENLNSYKVWKVIIIANNYIHKSAMFDNVLKSLIFI